MTAIQQLSVLKVLRRAKRALQHRLAVTQRFITAKDSGSRN